MAETTTIKEINTKLKELYLKVVSEPNSACLKRGFIRCPECGEEILMIPTLRKMNEAIENHVRIHKEMVNTNPFLRQQTAMHVRLDLAQQVLHQASSPRLI